MTTSTTARETIAPENPAARIFVVEDEALIAMELTDRLTALGYIPCGRASRGDSAVDRILTAPPDLVILDINLIGRMTGIDVAEQLRDHGEVPFIFLTAYTDSELVARAALTRPHGYLTKPFDERELKANIEAALARHKVEKELRDAYALLQQRDAETKEINRQLQEALACVKELRGILPICMSCNKIRDERDVWRSLDTYLTTHTRARLSHGYCPPCFEAYMSSTRISQPANRRED